MKTARALQPIGADKLSDEQLVNLALKGEDIAFRQIMQRHDRRLYRTPRGILGEDSEAEDVVQEAYIRALQHLDSFRQQSAFPTWLTRIVINEALGRKRKRRTTVELSHLDMPNNREESA